MIPVVGVEPTLLAEHDFESCASANSATPACVLAGVVGIEPTPKVLETFVLPLNYTPKGKLFSLKRKNSGGGGRIRTAEP
jgi:hypothetical protein